MLTGCIVLGWNRADVSNEFFQYYLKNTDPNEARLCFVNNGSTDATKEVTDHYQKEYPEFSITVIHNDRNMGVAAGWNQGIRKLLEFPDIENLIILNNDIHIYSNQWIDALITPLQGHKRIVSPEYVTVNAVTVVDGQMVNYLGGWCLAFNKQAVHDIGYFNEAFYPCFYEDAEFCFRAEQNGYELYKQEAPLFHQSGQTHSTSKLNIGAIHQKNQPIFQEIVRRYRNPQEIVFYCPSPGHRFNNESFEGEGVGGAEASLICLSRELARDGYRVKVVNSSEVVYSPQSRLYYENINKYRERETDYFILYRTASSFIQRINATKIFWSTDQYTDGGNPVACANIWHQQVFPYIDAMNCISLYHKRFIQAFYSPERFAFDLYYQDLGVNEIDYWAMPEKQPNKFIWCSVPHRGLGYLFDAWPQIHARYPGSELVVTSDYRLWGSVDPDNRLYANRVPEGVKSLWKVPRAELVREQLTSEYMLYPSIYDENFGISLLECSAAGAVPITTKIGAIPTTVGSAGVVIDSLPQTDHNGQYQRDDEFVRKYTEAVISRVDDADNRSNKLRNLGRDRALLYYSWKQITSQWRVKLQQIEEQRDSRSS